MPDPSPSVPEPPIATEPIVSFESRVTSGISIEVLNAFHAEPPRGKEAGGILLGRPASEPILVEDFEPVLCEHRFGPSYFLSAEDLRGLEESVQWFRTSQAGDLQVLGFYRSQARPESSIDDRDHELMRRFFADPGSLFLLLKPGRGETITAELFVLAEGSLRPAGHPMLFPSDGGSGRHPARRLSIKGLSAGLLRQCDPSGPEPAANGGPGPEKVVDDGIRRTSLPPSRRRHLDTQELVGRNWTWVAALVALIVAAAVLGYRSVGPKHAGTSSEADAGPSSGLATPTSNPMPAPAPGIRTPMTAPQTTVAPETGQGIREALAQWERAVRSGDPGLIAGCYATQLDRYFQQRNSSSEEVRRAAAQSLARYGKPAILRISDLTVIPVSEDRAVASFRKHWQTSGPRIFAGEEQERLIFVKAEDEWKIASEEETKVYWTQKPRG